MKILAIRGANLASLAREFEIDLARGALAASGLFAIVGNTGAGKSTLLDAMCVALFDRTPRIGERQRTTVLIGRGSDDATKVGAHDVRALLRRGAGRGFAEVDFLGNDGRSYRARWEVHRARDRADGALQTQEMSLLSLDLGERLGGTRTETLAAIEERLGLSFDQFRRSALLAQGDFAAFLRADTKDRSELLERMTGTEIYSQLSIAAHRRGQAAEARIKELASLRAAIDTLSEDDRAALQAALAEHQQGHERARRAQAAIERAIDWAERLADLRAKLLEAERERALVDEQRELAAALRSEHELRRRAEPARMAWQATALATRAAGERTEAARAMSEVAAAAAERQAATERAAARVEQALAPVRALRRALTTVEPSEPAAAAAGGRAAPSLDAAPLDELIALTEEPMAWLDERRALDGLAAAWPQLEAMAEREASLRTTAAELDRKGKRLAEDAARLDTRRAALEAERHHARIELDEATRRAAIAAGPAGERAPSSIDQATRAFEAAQHGLERAAQLEEARQAAGAAAARIEAAAARVEAGRARIAELEVELGALDAERPAAAAALAQAEAALARLTAAASLAHARAALVHGDPCPLCGALEHPWAGRGAFDEVIVEQEAATAALRERVAEAALAKQRLGAEHAAQGEAVAAQRQEHAAAELERRAAASRWQELLLGLGELALVTDPTTAAAEELAREHQDRARRVWEKARTERSRLDALAKAVAEAQAGILTKQHDLAIAEATVAEAEKEQAALEQRRAEAVAAAAEKRAARAELLATLAERLLPFGVERERSLLEPAAVLAELRSLVAAHRKHVQRLVGVGDALERRWRSASEDATAARTELAVARASAATAEEQRRAAAEAAAEAERVWLGACEEAGLPADRAAALLGAPADRVHELGELLAEVERRAERSRSVLDERRRALDDHERLAEQLPTDDEPGLASAPLPELRERLHATRARAARLEELLLAARSRLLRDDADHGRRADMLAQIAAAERGGEVDRALAQAIGSHDGKLLRAFAQSLTLDTLLQLANHHLEELAPRYQLERVPRYDLELQVIDRDMGDEVRAVQSLSGGESFLVSLALALALSSLAAGSVRVRTLLIDEGFGTLDPSTLDSALAVLDALQATGRQVGIISHLPGLIERVTAHVKVVQRGSGRSEVVVPS